MAEITVIKKNIQKMIDQDAPESDIDAYIASEGVLFSDLKKPTVMGRVKDVLLPDKESMKFAGDVVGSTIKDVGYSIGLGHTREAIRGESPEPGPLSLRTISPPLMALRKAGLEKTSDVIAGVVHDATNLSFAFPFARSLVGGGVNLMKRLPGAAPALHERAIQNVRGAPSLIKAGSPKTLWNTFSKSGYPDVKLNNVLDALDTAKKELAKPSNPDKEILQFVNRIEKRILDNKGQLSMDIVDADRKSIGDLISRTEAEGGNVHGLADNLYSAYYKDLDAMKALGSYEGDVAKGYVKAIETSRKTFAKEDLANLIERNIRGRKGDDLMSINVAGIKDSLRTTKTGQKIGESIDPSELKEIDNLLNKFSKVPNLPPPGSTNFGAGKVLTIQGFISGAASLLGMTPAAALSLGGMANGMAYVTSRLLMTERGRKFMGKALDANLKFSIPQGIALAESTKEAAKILEE